MWDYLKKCLSSSDEVSFGRTMSGIAFLFIIGWDTFFVVYASVHCDLTKMNIHDILPTSEQLIGQVKFCAACYGINKVTEVITAFAQSRQGN